MSKLIAKDWIPVEIDTDRMTGGADYKKRMKAGGPPWLAIVDANGKTLITSDGPDGNIGCPVEPNEIDHFMVMLKQTRKHLDDTELNAIEQDLRAWAKPMQRAARQGSGTTPPAPTRTGPGQAGSTTPPGG